jgi:hypothetical protein
MTEQQNPTGPSGRPPSEEELRAAYEAELKRINVEDVLIQTVVSLINLGGRRAGLAPGTEEERDPEQLQLAIEGVRALLPVVESKIAPQDVQALRDAVSQLQMAFAQLRATGAPAPAGQAGEGEGPAPGEGPGAAGGAQPAGGEGPAPEPGKPGEPGPAQRSGRLWVPGQ